MELFYEENLLVCFSTYYPAVRHFLQDAFTNERILFCLIGSLNADDDSFRSTWMVEHDWLGTYPIFPS